MLDNITSNRIVNKLISEAENKGFIALMAVVSFLVFCCILICLINMYEKYLCCFKYDRYLRTCVCKKKVKNNKVYVENNQENIKK